MALKKTIVPDGVPMLGVAETTVPAISDQDLRPPSIDPATGGTRVANVSTVPPGVTRVGNYQQITVDATAGGVALTNVPAAAKFALLMVETAAIRWRDDGTGPTAAVGMPIAAGSGLWYDAGQAGLVAFRAIRQAGVSAVLNVTYYQ